MTVTVTTSLGTCEAHVLKRYASEVLVEVTSPAVGIAVGERLVVPRQRVTESEPA